MLRFIYFFVKEVELSFRGKCQKLRVVSSLTGGAHFIFKGEHSTVALRVYDTKAIDGSNVSNANGSASRSNGGSTTGKASSPADAGFAEGLKHFRDSFMYTIVFFVLPRGGELYRTQLTRAKSFVNLAQRSLSSSRRCTERDQSKRVSLLLSIQYQVLVVGNLHPGPEFYHQFIVKRHLYPFFLLPSLN